MRIHSLNDYSVALLGANALDHLPPRSVLAPLKPLGLGTPYRESLTSYFQRLADRHCIQPRLLAREFIVPRLGFNNRVKQNQADRFWRSPFFNGLGEVPRTWTRILADLTSVHGLDRLTLLPLHGLVGLQGISPGSRRWCPECLREGAASGYPYGQLLWEIGSVTACPKHGIKLVEACDCGAQKCMSPLNAKFLPHLCPHCGNSLSSRARIPAESAKAEVIRIAEVIGEVLGSSIYEERNAGHPHGTIAHFLNVAVDIVGEGNGARVARMLSVSKGGLCDWCSRHHLPSLPQAVSISEAFSAPLSEILLGKGIDRLPHFHPIVPIRRIVRGGKRPLHSVDHLEEKMQELLTVEPPVSVADAGVLLKMYPRELNRLQPDLTRALSERFKSWRKQDTEQRRTECLKVVRELAKQMAFEGVIPSMKRLEGRMEGELPKSFLFKERVACWRICLEARRLYLNPKRTTA